jgi:NAD(P)-dependent dehydrogenase (short-subunit alcohol dehydrogenase family)
MISIPDKIYGSVVHSLPSLTGKCYAITGCTSGTGLWTAIAAARKGAACLLLLNRRSDRAIEAEKQVMAASSTTKVISVDCDLQSFASVRDAATQVKAIASEYGGLDGLINNAGVMAVPDTRTIDGHDVQMQTNHLSHFLLASLLMQALEEASIARGESRVIQHSSSARGSRSGSTDLESRFFSVSESGSLGGDDTRDCFIRYHQTKLANSVFAMALHHKLLAAGSKVKSLCAEPGVSATSLMINMVAGHASAPKPERKKDESKQGQSASSGRRAPSFNFKPQSAADGACPLIEASFGASSHSGDFFMPGALDEGTIVGMAVKCMTAGTPTPTSDAMKKSFQNEELTMNVCNHTLLWTESEKATGPFQLGRSSKL